MKKSYRSPPHRSQRPNDHAIPILNRDMLWITLAAAIATAWWLDYARLTADEFRVTIDEGPIYFDPRLVNP